MDLAKFIAGAAPNVGVLSENNILINGQSIVKSGESFNGATNNPQELIDLINKNVLGVDATTLAQAEAAEVGTGVLDAATGQTFTVKINKLDGTSTSIQVTNTQSLQELVDKLNDQGGGLIDATIGENGKLAISANGVASLDITDASFASGLTKSPTTTYSVNAKLVLTAEHDDPITITRGSTGTLAQLAALGFRENSISGEIKGVGINPATNNWGVGDVTINGVAIDNKNTDSLAGKVAAINRAQGDTGVTASTFTSATLDFNGVDITAIAASFEMNGAVVDLQGLTTTADVVAKFNSLTNTTGVHASLLGTRIVLEGNVSSITFSDGAAGDVATGLGDGVNTAQLLASNGTAAAAVTTGAVVAGGIKLVSANGEPISVKLGPNAVPAEIGLLETNATAQGSFGTAIKSISIDTQAKANKAIAVIDNALATINDVRSQLGAINNRLEFTINNLANVSEKTSASRSRITDADFAAETAAMSRAQVLQQAATAMLAQSNARPQQVLSLLKG
jgi:flagellin